jgi:hypothetical protein
MDALAQILKTSPGWYPHTLDPIADVLGFVDLPREAMKAASFLDERALPAGAELDWTYWPSVASAVQASWAPERCAFIFHIGHVGSTLLSRLLEADERLLALREPLPLRTLAAAHAELEAPESFWSREAFDERLEVMLKLWSRPYVGGQLPVVKASSFCSGMARDLLARPSAPKAILTYAPPEPFLANLLAGQNNRLDVRANASGRLKRLRAALGEPGFRLSELAYPEMAAMGWASEMVALKAAADASPEQALWLDFERLLARPQATLGAAFSHLGVEIAKDAIAAIVAGPELGRYSKAPEHAYDAAMRSRVLAQARAEHGEAIAQGLAWLDGAAARYPAIAAALELAG